MKQIILPLTIFEFTWLVIDSFKEENGHLHMACKKIALKNFGKFTGKRVSWSLFINKVAGFQQLS